MIFEICDLVPKKKSDFHAKIVIDGVYKVLDNVDTSYRYSLEY
jgi:hypothetical protein